MNDPESTAPLADGRDASGSLPASAADGQPNNGPRERRRIGEVVVDLGFAVESQVEQAAEMASAEGKTVGQVLLELDFVTPAQLSRAFAARAGIDYLDLDTYAVDFDAARKVDFEEMKRSSSVPVAFIDERTLLVAMADPANLVALDGLAMKTGLAIKPALADPEAIDRLIEQVRRPDLVFDAHRHIIDERKPVEQVKLRESAELAPAVKVVNDILEAAASLGASDIHIEPAASELLVRFRIDGVVTDSTRVPAGLAQSVVARLKLMSGVNISERRQPQDGRMDIQARDRRIEARLVTLPTVAGEAIVIRLLGSANKLGLEQLGLSADLGSMLRRATARTHGAVLAVGPTGSGKSTTLYAALSDIDRKSRSVVTIEDPVEHRISHAKQVPVNAANGVTFAAGLRSILRADPDVIMVGEIRDPETAKTAIDAALTGHVVLSTLHAGSAAASIPRLVELGIEPFLLASSVNCIIAQRLVRVLCDNCKQPARVTADELRRHRLPATEDAEVFEAVGCARCGALGYHGRIGIYEGMEMTADARETLVNEPGTEALERLISSTGMRPIALDALGKITSGQTSLAEAVRVLGIE